MVAGVHARKPLRPWEQQQQQQQGTDAPHQQQDADLLQRQSLLQQALAAVCAALQEPAVPVTGTNSPAVHALLPVLAPVLVYFAAAMTAVSGGQHIGHGTHDVFVSHTPCTEQCHNFRSMLLPAHMAAC
jgi:hypothetical protein